eukprot:31756_1
MSTNRAKWKKYRSKRRYRFKPHAKKKQTHSKSTGTPTIDPSRVIYSAPNTQNDGHAIFNLRIGPTQYLATNNDLQSALRQQVQMFPFLITFENQGSNGKSHSAQFVDIQQNRK